MTKSVDMLGIVGDTWAGSAGARGLRLAGASRLEVALSRCLQSESEPS